MHIDHAGRIPYLLAAGFKGPIICSEASASLLPLVLEDAVKIGFTRNRRLIDEFLHHIKKQLVALPYNQWYAVNLSDNCEVELKIKLKPAGHILGSAYIECAISKNKHQQRVIFSGDLGAPHTPILPAPKSPYRADCLVIESTYGDLLHKNRRQRIARFKEVIINCLKNSGVILIPAFSIGRTQELLYEIEQIIFQAKHEKINKSLAWNELEIIIDSPLAAKFTHTYRQLKQFWDKEARNKLKAGRHPLNFDSLTTINDHKTHQKMVHHLAKTSRPCIVLAASGMCTGGRIVNYLKALIEDPLTDIVFVGYQAQGTTGRQIQQSKKTIHSEVNIEEKSYTINAAIHTIAGYSAHADQKDLLNFIKRIRQKPGEIRIVHGDAKAKQALKQKIEERFHHIKVVIP